jgi:Protein of unknown function (DUF4242)
MDMYLVFRRGGWLSKGEQQRAAASSLAQSEQLVECVSWLRSYVVAELDGSLGTICVFRASSPEAIRSHARRAELPVDEIVEVVDTLVVGPDSAPIDQREERR